MEISSEQRPDDGGKRAEPGALEQDVIVTRDDFPIVRTTPEGAGVGKRPDRVLGSAKGIILWVSPDFDEPLEDMKEYM